MISVSVWFLEFLLGMARGPRIQFIGATYHVMSRGNRKGRIFEDNRDRRTFLEIIAEATQRYQVECAGYSLMGNHYHLIAHTPRANISRFMKLLNGRFTQHMNRRHKWCGHVLAGRFKSIVIDDSCYLRTALAYIARNPVEAGLVAEAARWQWSSYRAAIGLCPPEPFLATGWIQRAFPASTVHESRMLFSELVAAFPNLPQVDATAAVLGDDSLRSKVRELIGMTMYLKSIPRSYRAIARPDLRDVLTSVTREDRVAAIRRAHVVHGYLLSEIAQCLGVHPTTVGRMLAQSRSKRVGADNE